MKYNIQRIENDSDGQWNYLVITDEGRIAPMRKTARAIRAFNPIQSKYLPGFVNHPISNMIEDIMEKIHQNHILFKYVISFHFLYIYISKSKFGKKSYPNEWEL